jgi:hypothetical protein
MCSGGVQLGTAYDVTCEIGDDCDAAGLMDLTTRHSLPPHDGRRSLRGRTGRQTLEIWAGPPEVPTLPCPKSRPLPVDPSPTCPFPVPKPDTNMDKGTSS